MRERELRLIYDFISKIPSEKPKKENRKKK